MLTNLWRPFPCHRLGHCLGNAIQCRKEWTFNYLNETEQYQQAPCFNGQHAKSYKSLLTNIWDPLQWHSFLAQTNWQGLHVMSPTSWHDPTSEMEIFADVPEKDPSLSVQSSLNWSMHVLCGAEGPPQNCRSYALAFLDEMERPYSPYKKDLIIIL